MKTELFIARRLRLAPSDGGRRSPAVGIAVAGVALAVTVMMVSMAVVLGFQNAIRDKVQGFEASLTIKPLGKFYEGEADNLYYPGAMEEAVGDAVPSGKAALVLSQPVVLKTPDSFAGVVLNAYGQGHDSSFESGNLVSGTLPEKTMDIAISQITASKLGLSVGDKVDGCFFTDGALKLRRLTVSGIYSSSFGDYDKLTAYASFGMLQKLRKLSDGTGDAVEIRGLSLDSIDGASQRLRASLGRKFDDGSLQSGLMVTSVFDTGAMYFNWLALLDANVVVILVIMSLVSGFTLISCIFILILQRVRMIGVLKSLGATDAMIRRVFMLLGARVIGLGLLIGNAAGISLLYIQHRWHLLALDPDAYFLTYVPVQLNWGQIAAVNLGAILLATLLMLLPASLVSRISPARTMHYE